jgi:hypothetical protein
VAPLAFSVVATGVLCAGCAGDVFAAAGPSVAGVVCFAFLFVRVGFSCGYASCQHLSIKGRGDTCTVWARTVGGGEELLSESDALSDVCRTRASRRRARSSRSFLMARLCRSILRRILSLLISISSTRRLSSMHFW